MTLLLLLVTWAAMVTTVLSQCVTRLRGDGVGFVVGHRLFSNGSFAVVDDYARYMIFNSAGVLFYKENLNLPNDPQRSGMYRLALAIIGTTPNRLYLMGTNNYGFTIQSGNLIATSYFSVRYRVYYWGTFMSFSDYGVGLNTQGMVLYETNGNKITFDDTLGTAMGANKLFNISYISRTSANPLLNEFYLTMFSNRTFIGGVDQANRVFLPPEWSAAAAVTTEASFYIITSSVGGNSQYIAFAGYYPWSASNKYNHYLRVKQRSPIASVSLQITDYHIWSVALDNTTATKMYFLTHDGSLYSTTFTTSSISTPTLLVQDVFIRYANLEILNPTKLLLRTFDSMAVFDITSSTLTIKVSVKPTGARHFGSKMFVLTHNFNVSLYEVSGESPVKDNSFTYIGKVKELIVSTANNRFYLLTSAGLYSFSLSNYAQIASLTFSQVRTMVGATSIISINDFAPLALQPSKLILLAYGVFGGDQETAMLVVNENNLTYVTHYLTGLLDNFLSLNVGDGLAGYDYVSLFRPDCFNVYYYNADDTFTNPDFKVITRYVEPSNRTEIAAMKDVAFLALPTGDKQMPRSDLKAGYIFQAHTESNRVVASSRSSGTIEARPVTKFNTPVNMMMQRLDGDLNGTMVFTAPLAIFILYPDLSTYHYLLSEDFSGGIAYQKSDSSIVFFNGEYEIAKANPLECYADPTKGYQRFIYPCKVSNCQYCSAFNVNKCSMCNADTLLTQDYSACLSTCNPGYLLNGMCYNNCPIEYYKYNAAINTCESSTSCTVTKGKLILGDMCNSVASCPSGSVVNSSKYCTYGSTSAASPTSTAIVSNPCSGGLVYWQHFSMCANSSIAFFANYTIFGGKMYCDSSTHFYDVASKRCLQSCGLFSGVHPQMGLICITAADCNSIGMFTDVTTAGVKLCSSACSASLWTNMVAMTCVTSCPYPGTYAQISNRTCRSSCGSTIYTLETNKSCLTSTECSAAMLLKTPSTMSCASSCGSILYLNTATNECLTSSQCISASRFLSPIDMKCVTACSGSQYLYAGSSQCLTASQCKVLGSGSGGGMLSEDDKRCVGSCNSTQYRLVFTNQCLSSVLCKAILPGNGGGLLSEGNKRCVASCNSTQFLLAATSQCLSETACLATSGYGKLSMYDRKCVSACTTSPQQYLASALSKCWLSTECEDPNQGNGIANMTTLLCDNSCSTGLYRLVASTECLTASACKAKTVAQGGSLLSEENMLCVSSCTPSQYYLAATSQCLSSALCQASFGNTGYLDEVGMNCVASCSSSTYQLTSSRQCLSDSQCLAAYSGEGLLSPFDHRCFSRCSSTQYLLESSRQCLIVAECLASNGGIGLLSTQDRKCVTACSATQYLQQASSSCLSEFECNSFNAGTGLTNTRDKTCVSSCPADLYIMASTQQCLTASDCHAYSNNTGLISKSDMKCLTSCQSNQYLLSSAKECLLANECRAYSANSGLLSESDKMCVVSCQPAQYLLELTQQCLTASECLDSDPVGGYLSDMNHKCLNVCGPTQYLIENSSRCVSEGDCWALNSLVALSSKLCEQSCTPNEYQELSNHFCYTKAECLSHTMLTKSSNPANLCIQSCGLQDYTDSDQKSCLTESECKGDNGKFLVPSNMTCVSACPNALPVSLDHECIGSCPSGYYLEEGSSTCVQQCPETVSSVNNTRCLRYLDFRIVGAEQANQDSVVVILEVYFESNSTSTVTSFSVELATLFKQVGIVTDTSTNTIVEASNITKFAQKNGSIEIEFISPVEIKDPLHVRVLPKSDIEFLTNGYRTTFHKRPRTSIVSITPPKISGYLQENSQGGFLFSTGKVLSQALAATKILTPLMMSTFMQARSGSLLCLVAQTYTKLMMLTHMNFKLDDNEHSATYYDVFKELLDSFNEGLMNGLVGVRIVTQNKQYVCEKGFDKLCFLTVEDNFFMSHMLSLIIIGVQALVIYILSQVFRLLKYKSASDLLLRKLKEAMLYAFILENCIEFWFTLLLNALIFVYRIAVLILMKLGGYLLLGVMLFALYEILTFKTGNHGKIVAASISTELGVGLPSTRLQKIRIVVFKRLREIVKEITTEHMSSNFLKVLLIHDFMFAMILAPGRYLGNGQMIVWLVAEVGLLYLVVKYRPFSTRVLNVRQITVESIFLVLMILMSIVPFDRNSNLFYSLTILLFSMFILVIDLCFIISEFVKNLIPLVKRLIRKKKTPVPPSPYAKLSTLRAESVDGLKSLRTSSRDGQELQDLNDTKMASMRIISARGDSSSRGLVEDKVPQKAPARNRIVPSSFLLNYKTSTLLKTAKPISQLAAPENIKVDATSDIRPLRNTFLRKSLRILTLPPKVETSVTEQPFSSVKSTHVRQPKDRRLSLVNLNLSPDPNTANNN